MIYVCCTFPSNGARDLCHVLDAGRIRKFDGMDLWRKGKRVIFEDNDVVICWGDPIPELEGVKVLNAGEAKSRRQKARRFGDVGMYTIPYYNKSISHSLIPRMDKNGVFLDLMNPPSRPDYWMQLVNLDQEFRIHSFNGKAIRAGKRVPKSGLKVAATAAEFIQGVNAHPWMRVFDAGWTLDYGCQDIPKGLKEVAHKAVKCLGLTFGAVDIGICENGAKYILDVDTSPVLDEISLGSYVRAIQKWMIEGTKPDKPEELDPLPSATEWVDPYEEREKRRAGSAPPSPSSVRNYEVRAANYEPSVIVPKKKVWENITTVTTTNPSPDRLWTVESTIDEIRGRAINEPNRITEEIEENGNPGRV